MNGLRFALALAAVALLAVACEEEEPPAPSPMSPGVTAAPTSTGLPVIGRVLPFQTIEMGGHSGIELTEAQVFVIEGQEQWEDFWARHTSGTAPVPPVPEVDFDSEMVVAVLDKNQPTAGYSLEITAILEADGALQVQARRIEPDTNCIVAPVVTQPFHIVRLAKSELPVSLVLETETEAC